MMAHIKNSTFLDLQHDWEEIETDLDEIMDFASS